MNVRSHGCINEEESKEIYHQRRIIIAPDDIPFNNPNNPIDPQELEVHTSTTFST